MEGELPPDDIEGSAAAANPDTSLSATTTGSAIASGEDARAAGPVKMVDADGGSATRNKIHNGGSADGLPPVSTLPKSAEETKGAGARTSHLTAIAVCVTGAVMSSMLQFAFVYGEGCV